MVQHQSAGVNELRTQLEIVIDRFTYTWGGNVFPEFPSRWEGQGSHTGKRFPHFLVKFLGVDNNIIV